MLNSSEILNASILIVDDQDANLLLLERMLQDAGYTAITTTSDPQKVCALHSEHHYDLILLDLQMPVMDGFQVMEGLKNVESEGYLPVLVITAQPDHKLRALQSGAKDFVSKPFDLVEMKTRIYNLLEVRLLYNKVELHNKLLEKTVLERTAELHASEARFRRLTELSSDWYWEQDASGHFTKLFGPVLEMLGIRIDEQLGNVRDDQGATWNDSERNQLEENLHQRRAFIDYVYSRTLADGSQLQMMVSGEPMFDDSGNYIGYRGIGKDVSDKLRSTK